MDKNHSKTTVQGTVKPQVYNIRGKRVVLDRELATAFGVETKQLKRVVKRHQELFTGDEFAFELTGDECSWCQFGTLNSGRGSNLKYLPFAFTEAGVQVLKTLMKSSVNIDFFDEPPLPAVYEESWNEGTVVLYQPNKDIKIDVRVENETVWLAQEQMALLFGTTQPNIAMHIRNIFDDGELEIGATYKDFLYVQTEGGKQKSRYIKIYNLDMIISVGYRVNTRNGIAFRQWATKVIKQHLMHKGSLERRVIALEEQTKAIIVNTENRLCAVEQKVDFIVDTKLPPIEMVFYEGENFKAYDFLCTLIESAEKRIILIDNYIDRKVLMMLNKRAKGVSATVYTNYKSLSDTQLQLDLAEANKKREAPLIKMLEIKHDHDRFLIIDNTSYLLGPSIKDAGVNRCAVVKMISSPDKILKDLM